MSLEVEGKTQKSKEKIQKPTGQLIILTGFPGAGKTEIRSQIIKRNSSHHQLVTTTSRDPRSDEIDGVHYYFLSEEEFLEKVKREEFVEYVWFPGKEKNTLRGTTKEELEKIFLGQDLVSTMDPEGAGKFEDTIKSVYDDKKAEAILSRTRIIFIDAGSEIAHLQRFVGREGGTKKEFIKRMEKDSYYYALYADRFIRVYNYTGQINTAIQRVEEIAGLSSRK